MSNNTLLRVVVGGILNGSQTWSFSQDMLVTTDPPVEPLPAELNTVAGAFFDDVDTTLWSSGTSPWKAQQSTTTTLASVRVYWFPAGATKATIVGESTRTAVPGTGAWKVPPQCAIVASKLTALSGRQYRGRMYLPCGGITLGAGGLVFNGVVSTLANQVAAMITAFNAEVAGPNELQAVVATPRSIATDAPPVTSIKIDNVVDTQRRRRDKFIASETGTAAVT